jgi:hypothetical protein
MENIMKENFTIIELSDNEVKFMEDKLDEYDQEYIKFKMNLRNFIYEKIFNIG